MQPSDFSDLSHFTIGSLLGKGTHEVFEAQHNVTKKDLALKKIINNSIDSHFSTLTEIDSLFKCRHPNIVRIFGYNEQIIKNSFEEEKNDKVEILHVTNVFMEKLDENFSTVIANRKKDDQPFSKEELKQVFNQILSAFWYLELKEKPHGDFRPQNLMVKREKVKQNDKCELELGQEKQPKTKLVYKVVDVVGSQKLYKLSQTQKSDKIELDLHYASPEVLKSILLQKPDCFLDYHKSDVFSVGLVFLAAALLEDLSIEKINQGTNASRKKIEKKLGQVEKIYGEEFSGLIGKMLENEASQRPSFEKLAEERKLVLKNSYEKDEEE